MSSSLIKPFQLLEVNIISAQDIARVSRHVKAYAIAWVHNDRKLSTGVDTQGHTNPTWNDKFVFRVDDEFLRSDTAAVMVEISALSWFRDLHIGTVRVLVGNLIPPMKPHHHNHHLGMRFVALQIRRKSGRPQGILNLGVALLDSSMRSMPLYTQLGSSAVGYRHLMGQEDPHAYHHHHPPYVTNPTYNAAALGHHGNINNVEIIPVLRRSRSDRSEIDRKPVLEEELSKSKSGGSTVSGSDVSVKVKKARSKHGSLINGSDVSVKVKKARSKHGSLINGSDISAPYRRRGTYSKSISMVNGSSDIMGSPIKKDENGKSKSVVSGLGRIDTLKRFEIFDLPPSTVNGSSEVVDPSPKKLAIEANYAKMSPFQVVDLPTQKIGTLHKSPILNSKPFAEFEFKGPAVQKGKFPRRNKSLLSDSVGPSPSEMAAALAAEEGGSSVDGWSLDESVEGLRSKLDRWRTELPPVYDDRGDSESFLSSSLNDGGGVGVGTGHVRRHTDGGGPGGGGLFSCFGNVYGYECSCVCGKPIEAATNTNNGRSTRLSSSLDSSNRGYKK